MWRVLKCYCIRQSRLHCNWMVVHAIEYVYKC
jgi:hypothetical protein